MANINSLLNPFPDPEKKPTPEPSFCSTSKQHTHQQSSSPQTRKKQKLCKDAAVFVHGPIRGECRYPPHEYQDDLLLAQHQQFEVFPMGEIADYPRHIPYNSEKKFFFEKTGRECLEVFQYQFKLPNDEAKYTMLWDYNIGLVRTTPLFKCTGHSKTTPAKMLNRNPGLRDICHSITGGALVAQGYWMPFAAAKAVAATFCWTIRFALTPVFGTDFPALCVPLESERFGDMVIDPAIVKQCTDEANLYRSLETYSLSRHSSAAPTPPTPDTPTYPHSIKTFRPKAVKDVTSARSSDVGNSVNYASPSVTPERSFYRPHTPVNTPRSIPHYLSQTRKASLRYSARVNKSNELSSPELSPKSCRIREVDAAYDGDSSEDSAMEDVVECTKQKLTTIAEEEAAAHCLMMLRLQGNTQPESRGRKRRASA